MYVGQFNANSLVDACVAYFSGTPFLCIYESDQDFITSRQLGLSSTVTCTTHNLATMASQKLTVGVRSPHSNEVRCIPSATEGVYLTGLSLGGHRISPAATCDSRLSYSLIEGRLDSTATSFMSECLEEFPLALYMCSPTTVRPILRPAPHRIAPLGLRETTLNLRTSTAGSGLSETPDTPPWSLPSKAAMTSSVTPLHIVADVSLGDNIADVLISADDDTNGLVLFVVDRRMVEGTILRELSHSTLGGFSIDDLADGVQVESHVAEGNEVSASLYFTIRAKSTGKSMVGIAVFEILPSSPLLGYQFTQALQFTARCVDELLHNDSSNHASFPPQRPPLNQLQDKGNRVEFMCGLQPVGWSPLVLFSTKRTQTVILLTCTQLRRILLEGSVEQPVHCGMLPTEGGLDSPLTLVATWQLAFGSEARSLRRCANVNCLVQVLKRALGDDFSSLDDISTRAIMAPTSISPWDALVEAILSWSRSPPHSRKAAALLLYVHLHHEVQSVTYSSASTEYCLQLSKNLLLELALGLGLDSYAQYYACISGVSIPISETGIAPVVMSSLLSSGVIPPECGTLDLDGGPPNLVREIGRLGKSLALFELGCYTPDAISSIRLLGKLNDITPLSGSRWWENLVEYAARMDEENKRATPILATLAATMPVGAAHLLRKARCLAAEKPPNRWFAPAGSPQCLSDRSDVIARSIGRCDKVSMHNRVSTNVHSSATVRRHLESTFNKTNQNAHSSPYGASIADDGVQLPSDMSVLPIPQWPDARLDHAQSLLNGSRPITLPSKVGQPLEVHLQHLSDALKRRLSLPFGRSALTLSTQTSASRDIMLIPPLVVKGFTADGVAVQTTDVKDVGLTLDNLAWAEFHNGCASGLRYLSQSSDITGGWIRYQCRDTTNSAQPGVLYAAGLLGHLNKLSPSDVFSLLADRNPQLTVAYLLGLGCTQRGTPTEQGVAVVKTHIRFLNDVTEHHDMPPFVELGGVISLGLMYQGSSNRLIASALFEQITRLPSDEHSTNRPAYSLCAGFSLGMIMLGAGNKDGDGGGAFGQRLLRLLEITSREELDPMDSMAVGGYGARLPGIEGMLPRHSLQSVSRATPLPCTTIFEGSHFNKDVIAPAACAALLLIYAASNDRSVADRLRPVSDGSCGGANMGSNHIEANTPIIVLLRVLASNVILWDSIDPSLRWLYGGTSFDRTLLGNFVVFGAGNPQHSDDFSPQKNPAMISEFCNPREMYQLVCLAHAIAGACLSLGLRYAGSANVEARDVVLAELAGFVKGCVGSTGIKLREGVDIVEDCICCCLSAVGLIMAGFGDAVSIVAVQKVMEDKRSFSHSTYVAASMAVGMLFLSGGTQTYSCDVHSIASLFISVFPMWTSGILGGGLSVLRHLHTLSCVPRRVEVRDALTNEPLSVEIFITTSNKVGQSITVSASAPTVLPRADAIEKVELRSWLHFPVCLTRSEIEYSTSNGRSPLCIRVLQRCFDGKGTPNELSFSNNRAVEEIGRSLNVVRKSARLLARDLTAGVSTTLLHHVEQLRLVCLVEGRTYAPNDEGQFITPDVLSHIRAAFSDLLEPSSQPELTIGELISNALLRPSTSGLHPLRQLICGETSATQIAQWLSKQFISSTHTPSPGAIASWIHVLLSLMGLDDSATLSKAKALLQDENVSSPRKSLELIKLTGMPLGIARRIVVDVNHSPLRLLI